MIKVFDVNFLFLYNIKLNGLHLYRTLDNLHS